MNTHESLNENLPRKDLMMNNFLQIELALISISESEDEFSEDLIVNWIDANGLKFENSINNLSSTDPDFWQHLKDEDFRESILETIKQEISPKKSSGKLAA